MDRLDKDTEATSPDTQNQGATQDRDQIKADNSRKMEDKRAENEEKDKVEDGLLLSIHQAKIKFNAHLGEFKVLNDVPTTQGKLTGTIVEKKIPNFTFYDGFKMISLVEWQDFGTAKVQDNFVLLKKSTLPGIGKLPGNIPPETGKIEFVTSGQINKPGSIDAEGAPVPSSPVSVHIGRVIRGNPYVEKNASAVAGVPDSVPLNKTYEVEVTITGKGSVDLAIINSNADNGNASVTPSTITTTTKVIIKGTAMTNPGHGGQLKIEAKIGGVVKATSQGFSVCCHAINFSSVFYQDVNQPNAIGVKVENLWESDSGSNADLINLQRSEVVKYSGLTNDNPPFPPLSSQSSQNSSWKAGYPGAGMIIIDSHTIPRSYITLGKSGIMEAHQLFKYKCACCGALDIVVPNSGFRRTHEIFNTGTKASPIWKHKTTKTGFAVTIGGLSTLPANANVVSPDHNLP